MARISGMPASSLRSASPANPAPTRPASPSAGRSQSGRAAPVGRAVPLRRAGTGPAARTPPPPHGARSDSAVAAAPGGVATAGSCPQSRRGGRQVWLRTVRPGPDDGLARGPRGAHQGPVGQAAATSHAVGQHRGRPGVRRQAGQHRHAERPGDLARPVRLVADQQQADPPRGRRAAGAASRSCGLAAATWRSDARITMTTTSAAARTLVGCPSPASSRPQSAITSHAWLASVRAIAGQAGASPGACRGSLSPARNIRLPLPSSGARWPPGSAEIAAEPRPASKARPSRPRGRGQVPGEQPGQDVAARRVALGQDDRLRPGQRERQRRRRDPGRAARRDQRVQAHPGAPPRHDQRELAGRGLRGQVGPALVRHEEVHHAESVGAGRRC